MAGGYSVTFSVVDNATKQIDAINRRMAQLRAPMERLSKQVSRFVDVSGLRKVAEGFEWIGKAAMNVFRAMSAIIAPLGVITGAATLAGIVKLVGSYAEWAHTLVQTADNLGVTTQELQRMQDATRLAGGSAEDMTSAMKALHDAMGDFALGRGNAAETAQAMNLLGIRMKDANGKLRDTGTVTREVIRAIAAMPDPVNRARLSAILLGGAGDKLVETFRQTTMGIDGAFDATSRYKNLTDEQKRSLQLFSEAQGRAGVAVDHLGQQISAMIARDFSKLLNGFSGFVERNTPDILDSLKKIVDSFGELWKAIIGTADEKSALKTITDNIKEMIDGLKWLVDQGNNIAEVLNRLSGGDHKGLLAPIVPGGEAGTVVPSQGLPGPALRPEVKSFIEQFYDRIMRGPANIQPGYQPQSSGGGYLPGGATPAAYHPPGAARPAGGVAPPSSVMPAGTVTALPGDTSWGDYGTRANNPGNLNYADWEGAAGKFAYRDAHTGGMHTMATFATMPEGIAAAVKLMQRNQAKYGATLAGALHGWAENPYVNKLGMDPNAPFDVSKVDPGTLAGILGSQFRQEGRKGTHTATPEQILAGIELARRPPGSPAPGTGYKTLTQEQLTGERQSVPIAPPVRGSVDVSITHKNGPPNSAVTATGSGAVNVAPVRVEHQDMASI